MRRGNAYASFQGSLPNPVEPADFSKFFGSLRELWTAAGRRRRGGARGLQPGGKGTGLTEPPDQSGSSDSNRIDTNEAVGPLTTHVGSARTLGAGSRIERGSEREHMPVVKIKENESFEQALRRFKKTCEKAGVLTELRRREYYDKPSIRKKKKAAAARKRALKKMRRMSH